MAPAGTLSNGCEVVTVARSEPPLPLPPLALAALLDVVDSAGACICPSPICVTRAWVLVDLAAGAVVGGAAAAVSWAPVLVL